MARRRAKTIETTYRHLKEVLSKAKADLAKARVYWALEKEKNKTRDGKG